MMMAMILIATSINAQGILVEGVSKLIHSLLNDRTESKSLYTTTKFTSHEDSYHFHTDYHPVVSDRFAIDDLEIVYEPRVVIEDWMSEALVDEIDIPVKTEKWMVQPISKNIETVPVVENWMTKQITEKSEPAITLEDWMTVPLHSSGTNKEKKIEVELWMTAMLR